MMLLKENTIPFDKLTAETALYWRCLVHFKDELPDNDDNKADLLEKLIPELTVFCNYIRSVISAKVVLGRVKYLNF